MLDEFQREEGLRHFYRGLALERANRVVEAVEEYRRAIATYPYLREAHDALGLYYQRSGLLAKAADEFHIVANLEGDFLSYFNLGYVLVKLERYEEALEAFQRCLQLEPDDSATHYEIGFIHFSQGEFRAALDHLQRPLHSYPEDWEVHNLLGKCYLGLRRYDEALAGFGPLGFCLVLPAVGYALWRGPRRLKAVAVALCGYLYLVCLVLAWQPGNAQHLTIFFACGGFIIAFILPPWRLTRKGRTLLNVFSLLLFAYACLGSPDRPLATRWLAESDEVGTVEAHHGTIREFYPIGHQDPTGQ